MKKFKIKFDKEACIGCEACTSVCSNWIMERDKAKPKKTEIKNNELNDNREAEEICPVKAIKIE